MGKLKHFYPRCFHWNFNIELQKLFLLFFILLRLISAIIWKFYANLTRFLIPLRVQITASKLFFVISPIYFQNKLQNARILLSSSSSERVVCLFNFRWWSTGLENDYIWRWSTQYHFTSVRLLIIIIILFHFRVAIKIWNIFNNLIQVCVAWLGFADDFKPFRSWLIKNVIC